MEIRNNLALFSYGFDTFVLGLVIARVFMFGPMAGAGFLFMVALGVVVGMSVLLFIIGRFFPKPTVSVSRYSSRGLLATIFGLLLGILAAFIWSL